MTDLSFSGLGGLLSTLWQLAWGAMTFNPEAFAAVVQAERGTLLALIILLLGGISLTFGQSAVLFANRVPPRRFILSLLAGATALGVGVMFWSLTLWAVLSLLDRSTQNLGNVLAIVALSFSPYLLGFLVLFPYLGNLFGKVLRVWVLLILLMAVESSYDIAFWQALLACGLGWLVFELLNQLPVFDLGRLEAWLWRESTGKVPVRDTLAMADEIAENLE